ncbi:hypothetical protein IH575_00290 [Candidatus Dojkabacteria bacterium]|nr:hypothetical protein [Candidatus Dojkabacteria bacterium]
MLDQVVVLVGSLVGFSALISLLINAAKWIGWVQEGQAQKISAGANLILILVVYFLRLFIPEFDIVGLDPIMSEAAAVGTLILSFILQLGFGKVTHETVKGLPIVGKSFSLEREKDLG